MHNHNTVTDNWTPNRRTFQPRRKPAKRSCGSCNACCKLMGVPDVVPAKPKHDWCAHALHPAPSCGGCAIYRTRPESCRDFHCMYLVDNRIAEYWYPAKSKIMINATLEKGSKYVSFIVDPAYPLRWREEPWFSDIKDIARAGLDGRRGEKWTTVVQVGDDRIPIIGSERLLRVAE